ncbi:KAP family P-loop NTPase fold protein [Mycobacteroides abscessus]|uniref:KAP family P-loop NTPase fold protein n=4 Tax=Mycobacteroides abscessus TaxID=36809 RepID=UPI0009D4AD56|nr:P-loop NTPase fold protein [Mycobacteroides abscessus]NOS01444.1 AAA family ATPase [Mycobacteroides abscessus]SKI78779.1 Predicted P-loop ATPase [Mycobacteroides abscessus subsp. massiliense]SKI95973.1 Predicted P-loop ATPase [Mycobacteroides abscessus subsp. massiliense]SKK18717.1 Predicted P-loop ATPase [Mycobacteroides abscessus subsp. massiliense]SKR70908.1 Predicted P-loop ATPase [Mycobacteroides abscessus subsp. massiliense]
MNVWGRFRHNRNREEALDESLEETDLPVDPLWTDDALDSDSDDDLDRKRFADMVAARINACKSGQNSAVFGLVGPWGSGKTTLINFIRARLEDDWEVAVFSPWASNSSTGLQLEFLSALASLLKGDDEKTRNAKSALLKYAAVCAPLLGAIPVVGGGIAGVANKALELATPPWHKQFEDVSSALASLGTRVLLVADDIDRLDADELLELLKIVRLLGRFRNVHYLIAYDQTTVEALLDFKGLTVRSTDFMEKIVQYPFEVPPIAGIIQRRLLTDTITELIEKLDIQLNAVHAERFSDYIALLGHALSTPRAHARFKEQLLAFGEMLNFNEVDVVDYVALSFLRVFHHPVYEWIPSSKKALQSGKRQIGLIEEIEIGDARWMEIIRSLVVSDNDALLVKNILGGLFRGIRSEVMYPKDHRLALSDDAFFQRYFLFGIAEDDVEEQLIDSALFNLMFGDESHIDVTLYKEILDGSNNQRAALAYEKSETHRSDGSPVVSLNLVRFLFERMNVRRDDAPSFDSARRVLFRWTQNEVFRALAEGTLTVDEMRAELHPNDLLSLTVRMLRDSRNPESVTRGVLHGLGEHYYHRLKDDLVGLLDSDIDLNAVTSVVSFFKEKSSLQAIGENLLAEDNLDVLDRVVRALVLVHQWRGADGLSPELAFNSETLLRLFSEEAVARLAQRLPVAPTLSSIIKEDVSLENQGYFAYAHVRAIANQLD